MKTEILHGIIRKGMIELDEQIDFPESTKVGVIIVKESYREAWNRQRDLMKQGFRMEMDRKLKRDDLYERD